MATDDNEILQIIEDAEEDPAVLPRRWKVGIVDDDPAVQAGTRFALADYSLAGDGIEIVSAESGEAGKELIRQHPDMAVLILDVVMETENAGLGLVDYIRKTIKNEMVRIILRTGHPGQAPEREVIVDYDINDYKAKTELTAERLFTALTAALRSYQQLHRLSETRRGLEIIVDAASTLFDFKSMQRLAEGVLTQMSSLLNIDCEGILVFRDAGETPGPRFSVLAGSGCYRDLAGSAAIDQLDPALRAIVQEAFAKRRHQFLLRRSVLYVDTASGREIVVMLEAARHLTETDRTLIEVFCSRMSIAFDNAILYEQLQEAKRGLEERVAERTRELTAANRRLAAQGTELRRANALKNEVLGTVAHDLKNPLGVILGRAEMLAEFVGQPGIAAGQVTAQIGHIRDTARRLATMVDALIGDARNDAHAITIRREPCDLAALIAEIGEANGALAAAKGQTLAVARPERLVVSADPDRLREAIDNLVSNAIKYTPPGGTIRIEGRSEADGATVAIADDGQGLLPEDFTRLFGRFQRLSAKPTGGESSTGLGLSIVKRIVDLHGGTVSGESAGAGKGARFVIRLKRDGEAPLP